MSSGSTTRPGGRRRSLEPAAAAGHGPRPSCARVPAGAACLGQRRARHRLAPRLAHAAPGGAAAAACALYLKAIPTANTCSTGPGPTPTAPRPGLLPQAAGRRALHAGAGRRLLAATTLWRDRLLAPDSWPQDGPVVGTRAVCRRRRPRGLQRAGWMLRQGVQFHWTQDAAPDGRLRRLLPPAARQAQEDPAGAPPRGRAGVSFTVHEGAQIDEPRCGTSSTTATR
jgi:hypothetical protein